LKLIFAGTPLFAADALQALVGAGHAIELVLTQPDRPAGRGLKLEQSAVKQMAREYGLALTQPNTLNDVAAVALIRAAQADAMVVAAYGLILPKTVLTIPQLGCLNIHASLLPRWRGAAPIQRAILAGDKETGITIMQMNEGLDAGDILLQEAVPIADGDAAGSLHDKLAALGSKLILQALTKAPKPYPQDQAMATYAAKIEKREALIDWSHDAQHINQQIRAFNPHPGAATQLDGMTIKLWCARVCEGSKAAPGSVLEASAERFVVACGEGALEILEVQRAGGKRLTAEAFLAGKPLARATRFGA
jgi:methionyl-tRNA formyltransferase